MNAQKTAILNIIFANLNHYLSKIVKFTFFD